MIDAEELVDACGFVANFAFSYPDHIIGSPVSVKYVCELCF